MTEDHNPSLLIGYGRPPSSSRFAKGRSGNPKGRPKGSTRGAPYDWLLGRKVTINESGKERQVTAAEAFLLQLLKQGLSGKMPEAIAVLATIEHGKAQRGHGSENCVRKIMIRFVSPGNPSSTMLNFGMASKLDANRETCRMMIEPWLVQAAMERLGEKRFTESEKQTILKATRTPRKVKFPDWWDLEP